MDNNRKVQTARMALSSHPSVLKYIELLWIAQCVLVLVSPFIQLLQHAGTYGKLRGEATNGNTETNEKSIPMKSSATISKTNSSTIHTSPLLHPSFHIRTKVAFLSYYIFSTIWNGMLLTEFVVLYFTGSTKYSVILRTIGYLASGTYDLQLTNRSQLGTTLLQLALFQSHVMRRAYESIYIARFSDRSKQHFIVTILGIEYYFLVSFTTILDSSIFGEHHGFTPSTVSYTIGIAMFAFGWFMQHDAHKILAGLRDHKKDKSSSSSTGSRYSIPFGGLFCYVSMPHYFCEMLEYTGLWILSGCKFSQFLICVWVYSNLCITAVRSHQWYREQFPNYPRNRTAVIPGLI